MPLGEYLLGWLFYLPTVGAASGAAYLLLRRRLGYLSGLARMLAFVTLATAAVIASDLLPAALGILTRGTALAAAIIMLVTVRAVTGKAHAVAVDTDPAPPPSSRASLVIAVITVGAATVFAAARLYDLSSQPLMDIDMLNFHLPGIARVMQTGSVWRVDQFLPGIATAQYPNNGDFFILSTILPWHDMAFVRFGPAVFFALTAVAAYALSLELRASRAAAATLAVAAVMVPAFSVLAFEGVPDAICLATFLIGLLFLSRHARSRRGGELMIAGLALGIALGTKWYGLTAVAVVVVVWVAWGLLGRVSRHQLPRDAAVLLGMILAGGGFWLVRNLVESGNPIYPKPVSLLGANLFGGSRGDEIQKHGYTVAGYLGHPHILRTFIYPAFKTRLGLTALVLIAGVLIAVLESARPLRHKPRDARYLGSIALAVSAAGITVLYAVTPGSAYGLKNFPVLTAVNIRWLMPAILIGSALSARAVISLGRAGPLLLLAALAGALDSIHLDPSVSTSAVIVAALLAAVAVVAWLLVRMRRDAWPLRRSLTAAGVMIACLLAVGRIAQTKFDRHTYAAYDPTFAWIVEHASTGHRIGVTGVWSTAGLPAPLPAFGPRLGNQVAYVGDLVRHSVHLPANQRSFDAELRRGRFELVLIGLQTTGHTDVWARAAGYHLVALSPRLALYAAG
jgi:hypothetical protein